MFDKLIESGDLQSVDSQMVRLGQGSVEERTLIFSSGAKLVLRPKAIGINLVLEAEVTGNG